jgi:Flp pilus assembly protein TadG
MRRRSPVHDDRGISKSMLIPWTTSSRLRPACGHDLRSSPGVLLARGSETRRSEAGSALIEFAGSLMLLAVMFAGIFEIGYSFYAYGTLVTAVRAGARYAALQTRGASADPTVAAAVRNLVVYGDPAPADRSKPVVAGLTTEQVELINSPDASTVSLRGFAVDALFMKVKLDGRPTVTFPVTRRGSQ